MRGYKLTYRQMQEIRDSKAPAYRVAAKYGVSHVTVYKIRKWRAYNGARLAAQEIVATVADWIETDFQSMTDEDVARVRVILTEQGWIGQ
jgi:hypothetical protein